MEEIDMTEFSLVTSVGRSLRSKRMSCRGMYLAAALACAASIGTIAPPDAAAAECQPGRIIHLVGTQTEGRLTIGHQGGAAGISAIFCAIYPLGLPAGPFHTPASGVSYSPFTFEVPSLGPVQAALTPVGETTGEVFFEFNSEVNFLEITSTEAFFTTPLTLTLSLAHAAKCTVGPFSPTFTTGKSGALTGTPLGPPLPIGNPLLEPGGVSGKVVANEFSVPKIEHAAHCSPRDASRLNAALGLPLGGGASSFTTSLNLKDHVG
jgi:hypothetical protein